MTCLSSSHDGVSQEAQRNVSVVAHCWHRVRLPVTSPIRREDYGCSWLFLVSQISNNDLNKFGFCICIIFTKGLSVSMFNMFYEYQLGSQHSPSVSTTGFGTEKRCALTSRRSPDNSVGYALAYWSSEPSSIPAWGENLLNRKRSSTAHSLSLSTSHRPDMTETLLKRTYNRKSSIHQ